MTFTFQLGHTLIFFRLPPLLRWLAASRLCPLCRFAMPAEVEPEVDDEDDDEEESDDDDDEGESSGDDDDDVTFESLLSDLLC